MEEQLASNQSRLTELEAVLADEAIYADPDRKDELARLFKEQVAARSAIESLEREWLEASENLEQAT